MRFTRELSAAALLCLALAVTGAQAQGASGVHVDGAFNGSGGNPGDTGTFSGTFSCDGSPICTGRYAAAAKDSGCSNTQILNDALVITGIDLALPGPIAGTITLRNSQYSDMLNPDGTCSIRPGTYHDEAFDYTGSWNGTVGAMFIRGSDNDGSTFQIHVSFTATGVPVPFPMVVTGSIGPTVGNVEATIEFPAKDQGTTASVFVFALAPASVARPAVGVPSEPLHLKAKGAKADDVACVLAQLTSTGQLQQVSASQMQAYVTKVLTGQAQAVTVLNGVPTVQIAGATFFVGYGASPTSMLNSGTNRRVATAPGTVRCEPQKPQAGWWWNPAEGGRGFSLEVQGNKIFFASYLYDASGRSTWLAASGNLTLEGALFNGEKLYAYANGQTLSGSYRAPGAPAASGDITLAFNDATHGTVVWPGGTIPIERFNIVADGVGAAPQPGRPEGGWWWNPAEGGRGFFIEWQGGSAFLAGYMYEGSGNPLWYASQATTPDPGLFSGTWAQYANGQTLTGAYRAPTPLTPGAGPVSILFHDPQNATMTLPGGRTSAITRFRF